MFIATLTVCVCVCVFERERVTECWQELTCSGRVWRLKACVNCGVRAWVLGMSTHPPHFREMSLLVSDTGLTQSLYPLSNPLLYSV